ncbi:hypothetical protein [Actinomyces naeslundii]|uniref:hypothetical protein n=1 Tax=Actinomyces naeslundii TaxID=1655 RepID=UPI0028D46441|nr:hypothetical protein [Actinomyces naeslundii]
MGFQPSNTTSIKVGQVFLVGMMRHVNRPIYSDTSAVTNPAGRRRPTMGASMSGRLERSRRTSPGWKKTRLTPVPERSILTAG